MIWGLWPLSNVCDAVCSLRCIINGWLISNCVCLVLNEALLGEAAPVVGAAEHSGGGVLLHLTFVELYKKRADPNCWRLHSRCWTAEQVRLHERHSDSSSQYEWAFEGLLWLSIRFTHPFFGSFTSYFWQRCLSRILVWTTSLRLAREQRRRSWKVIFCHWYSH